MMGTEKLWYRYFEYFDDAKTTEMGTPDSLPSGSRVIAALRSRNAGECRAGMGDWDTESTYGASII